MAVTQRGNNKLAAALVERIVEFKAFASDVPVKLSPRMVIDLICIPTKKNARCSEPEAIKFMMMCQARKLNPWEGDAYLQGYDGNDGPVFSLITAHQAFLKRSETSEHFDGMESGVLVMDDKGELSELQGDFYPKKTFTLVGGWAKVHLKHRKVPAYRRLDLATFNKGWGRWKDDPAGMIVKCAEADALRSAFPSILGNLYLEQELNPSDKEKDVTPAPKIDAPSFITQPTQPAPADDDEVPGLPKQEPPHITGLPGPGYHDAVQQADEEAAKRRMTAAQGETPTEPAQPVDKTEGVEGVALVNLLKQLMKRDDVSEDQVIGYLRSLKPPMASAKQKELPELSDSKLRTLANEWEVRLPEIRKVQV